MDTLQQKTEEKVEVVSSKIASIKKGWNNKLSH